MFGSMVLEVAIGVVFVYLLLSFIVTAVTELIAGWLKWRSQDLWKGIRNLVDSGKAETWVTELYQHPLIEGLSQAGAANTADRKKTGPSYIPSRTFALALLQSLKEKEPAGHLAVTAVQRAVASVPTSPEIASTATLKARLLQEVSGLGDTGAGGALKRDVTAFTNGIPDTVSLADAKTAAAAYLGKLPDRWLQMAIEELPADSKLRRSLNALLEESHHDVEKLKSNIEVWFNNSMERVSGWYKRKTQLVHILLAVAVTLVINVDSVLVVNALSQNQALRDSLVKQAEAFSKVHPEAGTSTPAIEQLRAELSQLDLPVGWVLPGQRAFTQDDRDFRVWPGWYPRGRTQDWLVFWMQTVRFHLLGWMLTAFAISLGAPFWFDMLNKIINIRSSGKAPEEKPRSPQTVPQPREPGEVPAGG